ncbi:hypothetical protein TrRE_jg3689 [Triparma retinervis]|uniref:Uncharacterized protein n=1 Tax=Triparma retinervis TaxID=2557542 RepID=A0A9W7AIC9_9STRA|nr:hypothetical protein TrRE_jg3689 [Triparma retinervis]
MGRSKRSSAVAAKLRMDDIIQSSDSEVDLPPRKKSKSKTLQLTYSAPRSVRKKAAKKLPEFLIHHDDDSEDSVVLDERVLALEAWIDDDEQDKIRPNARTSCYLDSSDEERAATIISPSRRRSNGKGKGKGKSKGKVKGKAKANATIFVSSSRDISRSAASSRFSSSQSRRKMDTDDSCSDTSSSTSSKSEPTNLTTHDDIYDDESKDSFYDKPALGPFDRDKLTANRATVRAKLAPKTALKLEFASPSRRSSKSKRKNSKGKSSAGRTPPPVPHEPTPTPTPTPTPPPTPPVSSTNKIAMRRVHGSRSGVAHGSRKKVKEKAQEPDSSFHFDEEDVTGNSRNNINLSAGYGSSSSEDDYVNARYGSGRRRR